MAPLLFATSLFCLLLLSSLVRRFHAPGALPFLGVLGCLFFYGFGYAMEIVTPPGGANAFWDHFLWLGAAALPGFWIWLAFETPRSDRMSGPTVPLVAFLVPAATLVLNLTNPEHHLFYLSLVFITQNGLTVSSSVPGPWYWVHTVYSTVGFTWGAVLLAWNLGARGSGGWGKPLAVGLAAVPTAAAFLGYHFHWFSGGWDLIPFGLTATAIAYFFLLWPYGLLDVRPVTRETVFRHVTHPVLVVDAKGLLLDWNPGSVLLFPGLNEAKRGQDVASVLGPRPEWVGALTSGLGTTPLVLPLDGPGTSWWSLTRSAVVDRQGRTVAWVVLLHEQTDLVERAELFQQLALTDELTGCLNRRAFADRANRACRREPVALLAIDLDHFKLINDTWGHSAGDAALRHVVDLWKDLLRPGDLLGRTGGEEFSILLPGTRVEGAEALAGRLCVHLRCNPLVYAGLTIPVTGSFGVAGSGTDGRTTFEGLVEDADRALYEAKHRGRDQVVRAVSSETGQEDEEEA